VRWVPGRQASRGRWPVYADRHLLGEWAVRPGAYLTETGILRGRTDQRLELLARTTRAEALTIILRLLKFRGQAG